MRYIGTVTKVNPSKAWCFIGRKTIQLEDGTPAPLDTTKDVYLHQEDSAALLTVGQIFSFEVQDDTRRPPKAFRAYKAQAVNEGPRSIQLLIAEKKIDNPGVPMRWCLSEEMHRHIAEGLRKGFGYAIMIVAKQRGDAYGFREIREIREWIQNFTIVTFGDPGTWDVSVMLYEAQRITPNRDSSHVLEQTMQSWFLESTKQTRGSRTFDHKFPDLHAFAEQDYFRNSGQTAGFGRLNGEPIAVRTRTVEVPREVFAKEPSEAVKAFGNYFFKKPPIDQCEFGERLIIMGIGWIPYVLLEAMKRIVLFVIAMVCMLFCVKDWWTVGDEALEPKVNVSFQGFKNLDSTQAHPFNDSDEGLWFWFTPGFIIIYFFVGQVLEWLAKLIWPTIKHMWKWVLHLFTFHPSASHLQPLSQVALLETAGFAAVFTVLIFGAFESQRRFRIWLENTSGARSLARLKRKDERAAAGKERTIQIGAQHAAEAERFVSTLVCGDAPAEISLEALPQELRTLDLIFANFKQKYCRPFAR
jgi:hypothetical protein